MSEPTATQIELFKNAWHKADVDGRSGERVRDGLRAVLTSLEPDDYDLCGAPSGYHDEGVPMDCTLPEGHEGANQKGAHRHD